MDMIILHISLSLKIILKNEVDIDIRIITKKADIEEESLSNMY